MSVQNLTGQTLGQYQLQELLGVGGMGAVYRGYQASLERHVAIKVLTPNLAQDAEYIQRFDREAKTAASLEHSHIVPVYDHGTQNGLSYVVMRLLNGGTLSDRMTPGEGGTLRLPSLKETAEVLKQIASALDYAHSKGVIHRDIKASNVMFDDQASAFLVDFGIAKLIGSSTMLTGTGMAMGTPAYMPPEQWKGESLTPAADQYALSVVVYSLVTGHLPFDAPTPYALMHKHINEQPTPPETWRSDLPAAIKVVLEKALAKEPVGRFPSVTEFALAFEEAIRDIHGEPTGFFQTTPVRREPIAPAMPAPSSGLTGLPTITPPPSSAARPASPTASTTAAPKPARGNPLLWGAAIVVLLLLALAAFLLFSTQQQANQRSTQTAVAVASTQTAVAVLAQVSDTPEPTTQIPPSPTRTPTSTITATALPTSTATPATPIAQAIRSIAVRSGPGSQYPTVASVAAESQLPIVGISDDGSWFQVMLPDGNLGWLAASVALVSAYGNLNSVPVAFAPTNTATNTSTATDTPTATIRPSATPTNTITPSATRTPLPSGTPPPILARCPGALPSRLHPGTEGVVLEDDPRPLNVRSAPGTSHERVGQIPTRATFHILEGPLCADDMAWYRVRYQTLEGWIAEGDEFYFVALAENNP